MDKNYTPFSVCNQALFGAYNPNYKNVLMHHMKDLTKTRRERLASLVTDKVTLADVGRMFGKPDRQIKDMIAGRKSFGDKVARGMEDYAISRGYKNIYPYFLDGLENFIEGNYEVTSEEKTEQQAITNLISISTDAFLETILMCYEGLSPKNKESLAMIANTLYSQDHPNAGNKAVPTTAGSNQKKITPAENKTGTQGKTFLGNVEEPPGELDARSSKNSRVQK